MAKANRTALVTGGGGGVGRSVAAALLRDGHAVVLLGRRLSALDEAREALDPSVRVVAADVTDRDAVESALAQIGPDLAPPTVLVHAAGIAEAAPLLPPDDALWARTLATNATGAWITATALLPEMKAAGFGRIVTLASTAALRGYRHTAAYVASKHALLGLTRALAEELRGRGITANAVCPGFLDTPMTDRSVERIVEATGTPSAEARASLAALNASGRLVSPDAVATAVMTFVNDGTRTGEAFLLE